MPFQFLRLPPLRLPPLSSAFRLFDASAASFRRHTDVSLFAITTPFSLFSYAIFAILLMPVHYADAPFAA